MCLIAFAWRAHPRYRLALIANRDEFHARPAQPAGFDPERAEVYGGRDLQAGGSWLLASTNGRLAAVTNVRAGRASDAAPRSRGALVREFAIEATPVTEFLAALQGNAQSYGRFNLLLWEGAQLFFATNHPGFKREAVAPGLHAMSNGAFDAAWPKSMHASRALRTWLEHAGEAREAFDEGTMAPLFAALADRGVAPDALLPDTGVGRELERKLSPAFIRDPVYGTRCSSVVLVGEDGCLQFAERRYDASGEATGTSFRTLRWAADAPAQ